MHRKLLIKDSHTLYVGSANFTNSSLVMHHNILLRLTYRPLVRYCEKMFSKHQGSFYSKNIDFYYLPHKKSLPLRHLLKRIQFTKSSMTLMLYSLTHPQIIQAIEKLAKKNVQITIYLDKKQYMAYPIHYPFPVNLVHNRGLFHYKCGIFDNEEVVIGSANWTKNGFHRNLETLVFFRLEDSGDYYFWNKLLLYLKKGLPQMLSG